MPDRTVFAVDDGAALRNGSRLLLQAAGYAVEVYAPAAMFLDTYDPGRGGGRRTRARRGSPRYPRTKPPSIGITAPVT